MLTCQVLVFDVISCKTLESNNLEEITMDFHVNGIFSFIILVADIWAIVNILQSGASTGKKVLWTVLVVLLPVVGLIAWFFLGPKSGR